MSNKKYKSLKSLVKKYDENCMSCMCDVRSDKLRDNAIKLYNSDYVNTKFSERNGVYGFMRWFFGLSGNEKVK